MLLLPVLLRDIIHTRPYMLLVVHILYIARVSTACTYYPDEGKAVRRLQECERSSVKLLQVELEGVSIMPYTHV